MHLKLLLTLTISLCIFNSVRAQSLSLAWAKAIGGNKNEVANTITQDKLGNIYIGGCFNGTVDFDPSANNYTLSSNQAIYANDAFVAKYTSNGNLIWAKQFGGNCDDYIKSIKLDANANLYILGSFGGAVDFDPSTQNYNLTGNVGLFAGDNFLSVIDSAGNFVWAKKIGCEGKAKTNDFLIDELQNIYLTGNFSGAVNFNPNGGSYTMQSTDTINEDGFILKLNTTGNLIWGKKISGVGNINITKIKNFNEHHIYISGNFNGQFDFDPAQTNLLLGSINTSDQNCFIAKFDDNGTIDWAKSYGGTGDDYIHSFTVDKNEKLCITGAFTNTINFNPGTSNNIYSAVSNTTNLFILKLNQNGNFLWAKNLAGNGNLSGKNISQTAQGNYCIIANFSNSVNIATNNSSISLVNSSLQNDGTFILTIDSLGESTNAAQISTTNSLSANCLLIDSIENVFIAGSFTGTVDFDLTNVEYNLSSTNNTFANNQDLFFVKYNLIPTTIRNIKETSNGCKLFPNPSNGEINIAFNKVHEKCDVKITDALGRVVYSSYLSNCSIAKLNISTLNDGIYFIALTTETLNENIKIMKQ